MSIERNNNIENYLPPGDKELLLSDHNSESSIDNQNKESLSQQIENTNRDRDQELEKARKIIEEESKQQDNEKVTYDNRLEEDKSVTSTIVDKDVAKILSNQALLNIRRKLPKREKILSKIIHQNAVDVISEKTANTIARPSGLLGGAILAFIGSLGYLIFVKYVGITYNYLLFFGFFISGFILGLIIEFIIKAAKKI